VNLSPARLTGLARRTIGYARAAHQVTGCAARGHGTSRVAVLRRAVALRRSYGFALEEAMAFGMLDPARAPDTELMSKRETLELQQRINDPALAPLTENKAVFDVMARAHGLPVPETLALLSRLGPGGPVPRDQVVAEWSRTLAEQRGDVVVKPVQGWYGQGVYVLRDRGGVLHREGAGPVTPGSLAAELWDAGRPAWIVQRRLVNHPVLAGLGRPGALHTTRVVTVVDGDGEVEVLYAILRLAIGDAVDNFRGGSTGNLLTAVDLEDGTVTGAWGARPDGCGLAPVAADPLSGTPLPGWRMPRWDDVLATCRRAALAFLPLRAIGWDVAVTPAGPVLVEGNMWWDNAPTHPVRSRLRRLTGAT